MILALGLCLASFAQAQTRLEHWPPEAAAQLEAMIERHANTGAFAVFDADNTTYNNDLEEALLPFLEMKGVLRRDKLAASLQPIPFKDIDGHKESLHSYYHRLCEIDDQVCYPWAAQVFSGFSLRELKGWVDEMLASDQAIPANYYEGTTLRTLAVQPPKFYTGMQELYRKLMENGIEVYVVSAASEELVRMVLADPKNGYGAKPQNVIGVGLLLKDRRTGEVTNARKLIAAKKYVPEALLDHELTSSLWAPMTWFEGKPAAIHTYIDEWKKPILVAGDTPASDGPMLFRATDVEHGGLRVWVNRKDKYLVQIQAMQKQHAEAQKAQGLPVTADRNWIVVKPDQIQ
ncbi:haloacid dehalogenase-like hydrolase [Variovorax sp. DXTD-1]|uniref:haloacid dehalogenase-like hydrolase n=1 Tax=Variovorax sp. DXTD-1 TaxID=2495592 RepID=UPI000F87A072|nr:haloacid dehalogenase-like hydrolase [Variovorax sp. DXTD-1]RST45381.1 haloacid dehalogenase-like hydrolase [Variovorax sp. DXTD-1]